MVKGPLSPHLTIYKPQLSSVTSIIGRLCGIYAYLFIIISLWMVITSTYRYNNPAMPLSLMVWFLQTSTPFVATLVYIGIFVTVFCLTFFSGTMIRHILWDHNLALSLKASNIISYIIIFAAIIIPTYAVFYTAIYTAAI